MANPDMTVDQALDNLRHLTTCRCDEAYSGRGRHDPYEEGCEYAGEVAVVAAALAERDAEIARLRAHVDACALRVTTTRRAAAAAPAQTCGPECSEGHTYAEPCELAVPAPAEGPAVLNRSELFAAILVGIAGESDPAPTTEQCERAVEMILRMAARKAAPPRAREQTDPTDEETDHE